MLSFVRKLIFCSMQENERVHAGAGFYLEPCPPIFWTPYFNVGHPQIWDFTIERIGIGHPIFMKKNGILNTPFQNLG